MMDLFFDIPGNPVPENAHAGYFTTRDGRRIRYAQFAATGRPRIGTVVILTGRNECIEKYFETTRDLSGRGLGVATFDLRGQGASDRLLRDPKRGYVRSFQDYVRDLEQFFAEIVLPDCPGPYYLLAHSAGALIALLAAESLVNRIQRMVLLTPFLDLPGQIPSMKGVERLATALTFMGLGRLYAPGGKPSAAERKFADNKVTSDPERFARNRLLYDSYPQLELAAPTVAWLRAAAKAVAIVRDPEFMERVRIPTLFLSAGADTVVSSRAVEDYARRLRSGSLLTIDGAKHELLQETDFFRDQCLAAFDAFIPGSEPPLA
ncbi:alpha/beta hydrolase [Mesorhizobium sp. SB112]|uniref:alpha/beta hydrolase n=1 Tax=Mesorhizobium sp. SB112 TaxID=3151853 RepID=UPI003263C44D